MLNLEIPNYQFCPFCGDKLETKIEEGKERKFCAKDRWIYYPHVGSAAVAVIEKEGKILLVQRNRDPYKDFWMFPAGFVDFGEHPSETIIREVTEETGNKTKSSKLIDILQADDDPRSPGHFCIFYKVEIEDGSGIITDPEENQAIEWFSLDNLPEIGWNTHREIMKRLINLWRAQRDSNPRP